MIGKNKNNYLARKRLNKISRSIYNNKKVSLKRRKSSKKTNKRKNKKMAKRRKKIRRKINSNSKILILNKYKKSKNSSGNKLKSGRNMQ